MSTVVVICTVVCLVVLWTTVRVPTLSTLRVAAGTGPTSVVTGPTSVVTAPTSVVIAARNEEHDLPALLSDLARLPESFDLTVVDDGSTDRTAALAIAAGADVVPADDRPDEFNPKVWALDVGARRAHGDVLLFLDADIRITCDAAEMLSATARAERSLVSVVPCHRTVTPVESLSALCNVIMVIGAGPGLGRHARGAVGSTIAIPRTQYWDIGGHAASPSTIVDDLELATRARHSGVPIDVFRGGDMVSTRMYDGGMGAIWNGWTKNFAAGARYSSPFASVLIAVWLAVLIMPIALAAQGRFVAAVTVWAIVAVMTSVTTRLVGHFNLIITSLGAPLLAIFVTAVTVRSVMRRLSGATVDWKGRQLNPSGIEERR